MVLALAAGFRGDPGERGRLRGLAVLPFSTPEASGVPDGVVPDGASRAPLREEGATDEGSAKPIVDEAQLVATIERWLNDDDGS